MVDDGSAPLEDLRTAPPRAREPLVSTVHERADRRGPVRRSTPPTLRMPGEPLPPGQELPPVLGLPNIPARTIPGTPLHPMPLGRVGEAPAITPRMTAIFGGLFGLATVASIVALLIQIFPVEDQRTLAA